MLVTLFNNISSCKWDIISTIVIIILKENKYKHYAIIYAN